MRLLCNNLQWTTHILTPVVQRESHWSNESSCSSSLGTTQTLCIFLHCAHVLWKGTVKNFHNQWNPTSSEILTLHVPRPSKKFNWCGGQHLGEPTCSDVVHFAWNRRFFNAKVSAPDFVVFVPGLGDLEIFATTFYWWNHQQKNACCFPHKIKNWIHFYKSLNFDWQK